MAVVFPVPGLPLITRNCFDKAAMAATFCQLIFYLELSSKYKFSFF
jgi:hypothetical protein